MHNSNAMPCRESKSSWLFLKLMSCLLLVTFACSSSGTKQPVAAGEGWTITIKGRVGNPQEGEIRLQEMRKDGSGWQDTIQLKSDNTFAKTLTISEPGFYRLNFYNKQVLSLILHKSNLEVSVDGSHPQGFFEVKGSPDMDLIGEVQKIIKSIDDEPEVLNLNAAFQDAVKKGNQEEMLRLQQEYQQIAKKYHDRVAELLVARSPSMGAITLLQNRTLDPDAYYETYKTVADKLENSEWSKYAVAQDLIETVKKMGALAIGQPAPEIALPDPDGNIVKLSSLKGKYVLVDFWAKWCGPCRRENPNVVRAYQKYKDKGFTVFGVSLDRNREDWLQAIKEDNLTWTHVSDLKFWQSEAAKAYNVTAIPFSVLLDPNGIIIGKNLRGRALDEKLEEIFGENVKKGKG